MFRVLLAYFKLGLARHFYYRANLVIGILARLLSLSFVLLLWFKIFQARELVGGMTLASLVIYYLFAYIARDIASADIASTIGQNIKDGTVQMLMIRPSHPLISYFGMSLSKRIYQLLIFFSLTMIIFATLFPRLGMTVGHLHYGFFLLYLCLALILIFLISSAVATGAFWIVESGPLLTGFTTLSSILSGALVPIAFFPTWAKQIINILPFRYTVSEPVEALLGNLSGRPLMFSALTALAWIGFFLILNIFLWNAGTKRFDAVGN